MKWGKSENIIHIFGSLSKNNLGLVRADSESVLVAILIYPEILKKLVRTKSFNFLALVRQVN